MTATAIYAASPLTSRCNPGETPPGVWTQPTNESGNMTTLTCNRTDTTAIDRQPLSIEKAIEFCGTKKLAKQLLSDLGGALLHADRAMARGESEDTMFELMFWNGTLFVGDDDLFDLEISAENIDEFCSHIAYDEKTDATFFLGHNDGRRFVAVRWEWKESEYALSAWWLLRE